MSKHRVGQRRPGRPLLGAEPLNQRLTVMISASMLAKLQARAGDHVAEFVRRVLARSLAQAGLGGARAGSRKRPSRRGPKRVRRFT